MRNQFVEILADWAEQDDSVRLIIGDLGYGVVEAFERRAPRQFINAGIIEQSMVSIAAGMASEGLRPFVYSIANFPTFRAAEQIRNDVAHHDLPVTIVSIGGGLVYGSLGYSHHAVQDYALMRAMPEMTILSPGDPIEMDAIMRFIKQNPSPAYLRIGNPATKTTRTEHVTLNPGVPVYVSERAQSTSQLLLCTGAVLELANGWLTHQKFQGFELASLPIWGARFREAFVDATTQYTHIVTVEDHLIDGGFGSWVAECFSGRDDAPKITIKALHPRVAEVVGKEDYLREVGGLVP